MAKRKAEEMQLDMTPMIDVVFQLMIFFLVTVSLEQDSALENFKLPKTYYAQDMTKDSGQVTIQVDKQGEYFMGSQRIALSNLESILRGAVNRVGAQNVPVLIRGDVDARHKNIRKVMDTCSKLGIYKIRFAGLKRSAAEAAAPPGG